MKTNKNTESNKNRPDLKTKKEKMNKAPIPLSKNSSNKKIINTKDKNFKLPNIIPTKFEKKPQSAQLRNLKKIKNESNNELLTEEKIILSENEIIKNDIPLKPKKPNKTFGNYYLENKFNLIKDDIQPEIINGINEGIESILEEIKLCLEKDELEINPEQKLINEIQISNKLSGDIEESIKIQKIKDLTERKQDLKKKIEKLDEEIKTIEYNSRENSFYGNPNSQIVDENIRKAQMKEFKETKEILLQKLTGINEQVQKLMINEEEISKMKKVNIKQFLDNFEKDKEIIEQRAKKYDEEKKLREQKMNSSIIKANEKKEKEINIKKKKEEEEKKKSLEQIRLKELERIQKRTKENLEKIQFIKEHVNDKPANENVYLFKVLETQYKEKEENEIKKEIMKHKERIKENLMTKEEINQFQKKQKENEIKRLAEVEEERKKLHEQWKKTKQNLPKFESSIMQKVKMEEEQLKEQKEMEEFKRKIKLKEIKNYSDAVTKLFLPKIDENIKKEREDRIKHLLVKNNIQKHHTKKNQRILLVKPDPNKPKKYKWDLKLNSIEEKKEINEIKKIKQNKSRSKSANKHKPMAKPPDYLTEMRIQKGNHDRNINSSLSHYRGKQWEKMINDNKNTLIENVEKIKIKAEQIENKAKMNEILLNTKGEINIEMQENVSNMLIDAIKAKLTILENINK